MLWFRSRISADNGVISLVFAFFSVYRAETSDLM